MAEKVVKTIYRRGKPAYAITSSGRRIKTSRDLTGKSVSGGSSSSSSKRKPTVKQDTIKIGGKVIVGFTDLRTGEFSPSGTGDNAAVFASVRKSFGTSNTSQIRTISKQKEVATQLATMKRESIKQENIFTKKIVAEKIQKAKRDKKQKLFLEKQYARNKRLGTKVNTISEDIGLKKLPFNVDFSTLNKRIKLIQDLQTADVKKETLAKNKADRDTINKVLRETAVLQIRDTTRRALVQQALTGKPLTKEQQKDFWKAYSLSLPEKGVRYIGKIIPNILASNFDYGKQLRIRGEKGESNPLSNDLKNYKFKPVKVASGIAKEIGDLVNFILGVKGVTINSRGESYDGVIATGSRALIEYSMKITKEIIDGRNGMGRVQKDMGELALASKAVTKASIDVGKFIKEKPITVSLIVGAAITAGVISSRKSFVANPDENIGRALVWLFPGTIIKLSVGTGKIASKTVKVVVSKIEPLIFSATEANTIKTQIKVISQANARFETLKKLKNRSLAQANEFNGLKIGFRDRITSLNNLKALQKTEKELLLLKDYTTSSAVTKVGKQKKKNIERKLPALKTKSPIDVATDLSRKYNKTKRKLKTKALNPTTIAKGLGILFKEKVPKKGKLKSVFTGKEKVQLTKFNELRKGIDEVISFWKGFGKNFKEDDIGRILKIKVTTIEKEIKFFTKLKKQTNIKDFSKIKNLEQFLRKTNDEILKAEARKSLMKVFDKVYKKLELEVKTDKRSKSLLNALMKDKKFKKAQKLLQKLSSNLDNYSFAQLRQFTKSLKNIKDSGRLVTKEHRALRDKFEFIVTTIKSVKINNKAVFQTMGKRGSVRGLSAFGKQQSNGIVKNLIKDNFNQTVKKSRDLAKTLRTDKQRFLNKQTRGSKQKFLTTRQQLKEQFGKTKISDKKVKQLEKELIKEVERKAKVKLSIKQKAVLKAFLRETIKVKVQETIKIQDMIKSNLKGIMQLKKETIIPEIVDKKAAGKIRRIKQIKNTKVKRITKPVTRPIKKIKLIKVRKLRRPPTPPPPKKPKVPRLPDFDSPKLKNKLIKFKGTYVERRNPRKNYNIRTNPRVTKKYVKQTTRNRLLKFLADKADRELVRAISKPKVVSIIKGTKDIATPKVMKKFKKTKKGYLEKIKFAFDTKTEVRQAQALRKRAKSNKKVKRRPKEKVNKFKKKKQKTIKRRK